MKENKYNLALSNVYLIKTNNEFISDILMEKNNLKSIIINALSSNQKSLLLPLYIDKNKKRLIKEIRSKYIDVNNVDLLKFIIDNEILEYDLIFFGLMGLSYQGVSFLKEYIREVSQNTGKTFILLDYDPQYKDIEKILISK